MNSNFIKSTIAAFGLAAALIVTPSQIAKAADYTVTPVSGILYSNEQTQIYTEPDMGTLIVPNVSSGLPIQVTGVVNGFFEVLIGEQKFYIPGIGLSATSDTNTTATADTTTTATATSSTGWTEESVYAALMSLQSKYPEGMTWTTDTRTDKYGNIVPLGDRSSEYGGAPAFVAAVWKDVFGAGSYYDAKGGVGGGYDPSVLKVGDAISFAPKSWTSNNFRAIVLSNEDGYITIACSSNGAVHWGIKMPYSEIVYDVYDDLDGTYDHTASFSYRRAY